jgi:osmotically inducible protein OsmC
MTNYGFLTILKESFMPIRNAYAVWEGSLASGKGTVELGSGMFKGEYSFPSRFENGKGTNPEELIGAAHAGCFSMALSAILSKDGHKPERIKTEAKVHIDKVGDGFSITKIELVCEAEIHGMENARFLIYAEEAKKDCPVSRALAGTEITLKAELKN